MLLKCYGRLPAKSTVCDACAQRLHLSVVLYWPIKCLNSQKRVDRCQIAVKVCWRSSPVCPLIRCQQFLIAASIPPTSNFLIGRADSATVARPRLPRPLVINCPNCRQTVDNTIFSLDNSLQSTVVVCTWLVPSSANSPNVGISIA